MNSVYKFATGVSLIGPQLVENLPQRNIIDAFLLGYDPADHRLQTGPRTVSAKFHL